MPVSPRNASVEHDVNVPSRQLAENIRLCRTLRRMSQEQLATEMASHGHNWVRCTVSQIELLGRNVTVDELTSLADIFQRSLDALVLRSVAA